LAGGWRTLAATSAFDYLFRAGGADKLKEFNDRVAAANKQPQNDSNSKLQDVAPNFIPLPSSIPFTPAYTPTEVPTPMRVPEGALFEIPFEFFPI
jgi:hypothetical protein